MSDGQYFAFAIIAAVLIGKALAAYLGPRVSVDRRWLVCRIWGHRADMIPGTFYVKCGRCGDAANVR